MLPGAHTAGLSFPQNTGRQAMTTAEDDPRQAHIDMMIRYAHALDTVDWALLETLFTEDASLRARVLVDRKPPPPSEEYVTEGREALIGGLKHIFAGLSATHHLLGNYVVEPAADGTTAKASCYVRAYHQGNGPRAHLFEESLARFDFETVRDGGAWKIRRMQETLMVMLGTMDAFPPPP
jgi:hypothetical protein